MIYCYSASYYEASNGIKIGFLLAHLLEKNGIPARVACHEPRRADLRIPGQFARLVVYLDEAPLTLAADDIVVYPEIVEGNPLSARRVVRYLLNRPYYLSGGGVRYGATDYLTAYSRIIDSDLPQLFIMLDDRELIARHRGVRKQGIVSYYFGKVDFDQLPRMLNVAAEASGSLKRAFITRLHPALRRDIFRRLAESDLLVSFDPISNINYEASLLGTPVLLLDDSFGAAEGKFNLPLFGFCTETAGLDRARAEVGRAYETYCGHLDGQDAIVREWAEHCMAHFGRIEDPREDGYRAERAEMMKERSRLDLERYATHRKGAPLTNVNTPLDIPREAARVLGFGRRLMARRIAATCSGALKGGLKSLGLFDAVKRAYKKAKSFLGR